MVPKAKVGACGFLGELGLSHLTPYGDQSKSWQKRPSVVKGRLTELTPWAAANASLANQQHQRQHLQ